MWPHALRTQRTRAKIHVSGERRSGEPHSFRFEMEWAGHEKLSAPGCRTLSADSERTRDDLRRCGGQLAATAQEAASPRNEKRHQPLQLRHRP
jgi:hypothetical protein